MPRLDDGVDYAIQTVLGSHSDDMITSIMESAAKKLAMEIKYAFVLITICIVIQRSYHCYHIFCSKSMPHGLVCAFGLREVTFERMKSIIAALIETRPWLGASISSAPPSDKSATNAETQGEAELDIADVNDTATFVPLETMIKMFETAAQTGDFSSLGGIPELQNRFHSQMSKNNATAAETAIPQTVQTNSLPSEPSPAPPLANGSAPTSSMELNVDRLEEISMGAPLHANEIV